MTYLKAGWNVKAGATLALAIAAASSCGSSGDHRIPDVPRPAAPPVKVNLAPAIYDDHVDVTRSPKLAGAKVGKIILIFPEGGAEVRARGEIERLIRKSLLKRGIDLVVTEVRARVEQSADLRGRKEALTSVEKLIVLGKDTGADAMLAFDEVRADEYVYDVRLKWDAASSTFNAAATQAAPRAPACPQGFRVRVPAFSAKGRFVNMHNATILAEFDVNVMSFANRERLKAPMEVQRFSLREVRAQSATTVDDGCSRKHRMYSYVSGWQSADVLCTNLQQAIAKHVPSTHDAWQHTESGIDDAIDKIVSTTIRK